MHYGLPSIPTVVEDVEFGNSLFLEYSISNYDSHYTQGFCVCVF
jgi:hypothetical protein